MDVVGAASRVVSTQAVRSCLDVPTMEYFLKEQFFSYFEWTNH